MVICEECGQNFKTKQALSSHKRVHEDVAVGAKMSLATQEKNTENMLDFFDLLERGESPMQACLQLQVNPAYADRWNRIYRRLALKGEKGKAVEQNIEDLLIRLKRLENFTIKKFRLLQDTEDMIAKLIVDTSHDIANSAVNDHIKTNHRGFFQ